MSPFTVRPYDAHDLDSLYAICLQTGDQLYRDPKALGYLYAAPYAIRDAELTFVLEDDAGVCGYILGTADTLAFNRWLSTHWFPELRTFLPEPAGDPQAFSADERIYWRIYHPTFDPVAALADYPAHLHIDLLPRAQGQGQGRRLMAVFLDALRRREVPGVHLGLAKRNERALYFYRKLGFTTIDAASSATTIVMGKSLSLAAAT